MLDSPKPAEKNIPAFTIFQELLAGELGVGVGEYTHMSNSLHIYERHFDMVETMLSDDEVLLARAWHEKCGEMPRLPDSTEFVRLYSLEENIAKSPDVTGLNEIMIAVSDMDSYWADWVKILASNRCKKLKKPEDALAFLNSTSYSGFHDIDYFEEVH